MDDTPGLRRDAEDNRMRLLAAAREVFAEHGTGATLHDVARHAGVGVGTAYRRFANKQELLEAVMVQQVDDIEEILRTSLANPDPWQSVVDYLESALEIQVRDRALGQIMAAQERTPAQLDTQRDRLAPLVDALMDRAIEHGVVRPDVTGTDLVFVQIGLVSIAATTRQHGPDSDSPAAELYRRYLTIFLDGLKPKETLSSLPVRALTSDEVHQLLRRTLQDVRR
ncbi:TetR/AcrR family transcriptional regulator [Rathayibacter tanaceti]|uniref:TetR family transcriptional regulator n=3 Tax=Rathayibacter tanaceti TaxID=1671680 RepID=A0AAE6RJ54_9MICO|nr:TetR/AcrR family transcriptional regulator [Rathayibacter tanaceti]QHC54638.1 TetR family transcriptional regulator [Rathayibacter tanaceti]